MRTAFGREALRQRVARGMSQTEFCERIQLSLPRVSNIEHGRVAVSTDVVNSYISALNCTGSEAHALMKLADFANNQRQMVDSGAKHPVLLALLKQFGDRLSPEGIASIQRIVERETGEQIELLTLASNQMRARKPSRKMATRFNLMPKRLAEICFAAEATRRLVASDELHKVKFETALEKLSSTFDNFDYDVLTQMPSFAEGAFACITGERAGHTLMIEEARYLSAIRNVKFARHVLAHEIGHHVLHPHLLMSNGTVYINPQPLAKNNAETACSEQRIEEVVDTPEEAEAEAFATLFLIPWERFLVGTATKILSDDYGEEEKTVKTYSNHFKNRAVLEAIAEQLVRRGCRNHLVFDRLSQTR